MVERTHLKNDSRTKLDHLPKGSQIEEKNLWSFKHLVLFHFRIFCSTVVYPTHPKSKIQPLPTNRYQRLPTAALTSTSSCFLTTSPSKKPPHLGDVVPWAASCWCGYIYMYPTENEHDWLENGTRNEDVFFLLNMRIFHSHVSFQGCTSYGNEAMLTAKWQITLLTIVVTHQIHSKSALFKNNAFEPIWWIQSCSNRSTLERSFKKTEWYLRTEMSWSCLGLIFWVYSTSIYFRRSNVVKSPNIYLMSWCFNIWVSKFE